MPKQVQTPQLDDYLLEDGLENSATDNSAPAKKRVVIKPKVSANNSSNSAKSSDLNKGQSDKSFSASPKDSDNPVQSDGVKEPSIKKNVPSYQWVLSDLIFIAAVGLSFYLVIIFAGYNDQDPGFVFVDNIEGEIANYGGRTGAWLSSFLLYIFGVFGYLLPIGITIGGWMTLKHPAIPKEKKQEQDYSRFLFSLLGVLLFVSSGAAMSNLFMAPDLWLTELPFSSGGVWGYSLSSWLVGSIDLLATTLVLLGVWAWSLSLLLNRSWMSIFEITGELTENFGLWFYHRVLKGEKTRQIFQFSKDKLTVTKAVNPAQATATTSQSHSDSQKILATSGLKKTSQRVGGFFKHLISGPNVSTQHHEDSLDNPISIDSEKAKQVVSSLDQQTNEQPKSTTPSEQSINAESVDSSSQHPIGSVRRNDFQPSENELDQASVKMASSSKQAIDNQASSNSAIDIATPKIETAAMSTEESPAFSVEIGERVQALPPGEIYQKAELPSLELLAEPPYYEEGYTEEELTDLSFKLEQSLDQFGIKVSVESVQPGPVVTRFEILPAPGIKVSKINNLSKDLARVMMVESVRVVDVIVGKSVIGIEIPNKIREVVSFREVLSSNAFQDSKSALTIALGKDISGEPIVADIAKMPHLLVAGTTGAGKSVGVNSMILSMLFKSTAQEVRMILIDPKMLELSIYEDIPHLLSPVVTDMNDAANALRWCVFEMDRRYELMSKLKVRNMAGFNAKVKAAIEKGQPLIDPLHEQLKSYGYEMGEAPPTLEPLPNIVVVIDEFADMIMTVGKEVEQLIARLAQKARAAGIHLILATQRPSVNVITGLIKANIPTRIAFMVNTKIDSRTILEQGGAEQLLGKGDMLYMPPGSGTPMRVHGAFMTDEEVNEVAEFVKSQGEPQYIKAITEAPPSDDDSKAGTGSAEDDPLYDEIVAFITEKRKVSVSLLQRHFSIGYNRSARIVEGLEAAGLISAGRGGNNVREVLVPKRDEFDE